MRGYRGYTDILVKAKAGGRVTMSSRSPYLPGRPSYRADIDLKADSELPLLDKFYGAVQTLTPREVGALAHGLYCSRACVWRWQHGQTAPTYGTMVQVIAWVERGKPVIKTQHKRWTMFTKRPVVKPRKHKVVFK